MTGNRKPFTVSNNRKDIVNDENSPSLLDVPSDVLPVFGSWLDIKYKGRYVKTCRTINNFFQPDLEKEAEPFVAEALHFAALGMKDELDALLTKRPGLIYKSGTTLDIRDRTVHGTVYRIALAAKDWNPFPEKKFEEMAEMIERHMKKLPKGEEEMKLQKAEQFPEGWEEEERKREEKDSEELKKVFAAIGRSKKDEDCAKGIEQFINYLKSQNEVKTGYHFNDKLLSEAEDLYIANYAKFGGYDSRKNRLAAFKIVGGIQDRMTACLAMAHCDGLSSVTEEKKQLSRKLTLDDGSPFFSPGLGTSHYVYSYYGAAAARGRTAGAGSVCADSGMLTKLMSSKNIKSHQWQSSEFKQSELAKRASCVIL